MSWFEVVGAGFIQLFVSIPLEDALERNRKRNKPVDENVIKKMFTDIEIPNPIEHKWESHSLVITSTNMTTSDAIE
jgi:tRNA uridine 5-carbamoylmethylation protein Kti12